jgi:hypothetical protein
MQAHHFSISVALFFAGTSLAVAQVTPSTPEMPMPDKPAMPATPEPPAATESAAAATPAPQAVPTQIAVPAAQSVYPPCSASLHDQCSNSTHSALPMHHRKARKRG